MFIEQSVTKMLDQYNCYFGIPIDIQKRNIKNIHLQIKPPDGYVVISASLSMDDMAIEVYARTNLGWIKNRLISFSINQEARSDSTDNIDSASSMNTIKRKATVALHN